MTTGPIPNPTPVSSTDLELDGHMWHVGVEWGLLQNRVAPVRISFTSCTPTESGGLKPDGLPITAARIRRLEIGTALKRLRPSKSSLEYVESNLRHERDLLLSLEDHAAKFHQDGSSAPRDTDAAIDACRGRITDLEALLAAATGPQRGRRLTPDVLAEVAEVYLRAKADPDQRVTAAVATHFNINKSTAGKRIMAARDDGFLERKPKDK